MAVTYTVKKGDTLSEIALTYKDSIAGSTNAERINTLVKLNNINDPDYIVVGQVLKLSGTADTVTTNTTYRAKVTAFGLQSNTDRTIYACWQWDQKNTKNYTVRWYYCTGDKDSKGNLVQFGPYDSTVTIKQATYNAPSNAISVKFYVRPEANTRKVNGKDTAYWNANFSSVKTYTFSDKESVNTPPVPTVTMDGLNLTASVSNVGDISIIQFEVVKNDSLTVKTIKANVTTGAASMSTPVEAGGNYKVRCRANKDGVYSEWSNYSNNVGTVPAAPSEITKCEPSADEGTVRLEWKGSATATSYDVEYTTNKTYFDSADQAPTSVNVTTTVCVITNITIGQTYFFRVRSKNDKGTSGWTEIQSIVIGTGPAAPTTWSSTTTAVRGEDVTLYWVHNSEDGSKQTHAHIEVNVGGTKIVDEKISFVDDETRKSQYVINTSSYSEGAKLLWRVRTAGITATYGEWSALRAVDVYAPPTLQLTVTDGGGNSSGRVTGFPIKVTALAGPTTQASLGYHLSIKANESYETTDSTGKTATVSEGTEVYSQYFDITTRLSKDILPSDAILENNVEYTLVCVVSMNSGLTATDSYEFTTEFSSSVSEPNMSITVDNEALSANILPYVIDEHGNYPNVSLSVYRHDFDGRLTEIAANIVNNGKTIVTDPHPTLDYARYRIVARSGDGGSVSYYDPPGYPIGEKSLVIQWDEQWSNSYRYDEDELVEPSWSGSMLQLSYNIDITNKYSPDVSLIEYAGREHPVSYYGTQLGETMTLAVAIDKNDHATIYALRRLAKWRGDVYVRTPSGAGYWANVTVSFPEKHRVLTVPVTIEVVRVEGGM